jgi:hypothetical protein
MDEDGSFAITTIKSLQNEVEKLGLVTVREEDANAATGVPSIANVDEMQPPPPLGGGLLAARL